MLMKLGCQIQIPLKSKGAELKKEKKTVMIIFQDNMQGVVKQMAWQAGHWPGGTCAKAKKKSTQICLQAIINLELTLNYGLRIIAHILMFVMIPYMCDMINVYIYLYVLTLC